ncbi:BREX-2 system adenine-specific DNA-methyltransferase PglX [Dactylosporangium aurantiacum]|uniref:site-specific DNA-methyltransferase (adenine-specific) n=1 Tax=Dactylosporangium aurantiacum TaxID=35754 RepID=A0A9Q9IK44_9ACTN|nr:BREX-2 system adenine-specific DNA-methyltransferase PglX [Dactylosporangium aurantiacum]MDG6109622.1 BREX-2 system adenine-specific DNA-methyltransferase PglX [Dactylosporangium aurantiacum]UWZ54240.1 BREX-2 system adenine-specific DNA-methyltransferase PglX [Dactylosporangium aurantiacum]
MIELKPLQAQVKLLVDDLRGQVASDSDLHSRLSKEHSEAKGAKRTGGTFETWLEDVLDQAAVAWVLGCVFVRFCEDNKLVDGLWLGGSEPHAAAGQAVEQRQAYLIQHPTHNDRHWLREAFKHLRALRATVQIFDEHNPVWRFDISGQAAENLSEFFRRGPGLVSLRSDELDTRFLGDLYQDLSAHAKATYALLQTPLFVEEFILDRTFEPAVKEFGLAETKVIDPTCGSGHFLLGAFARLLRKWQEREPATPVETLVERVLAQVTGVDLNPFAVAIARFRLVVAALQATGRRNLATAYPVRVAAGDSLLMWGNWSTHQGEFQVGQAKNDTFAYFSEDADLLAEYLVPGQYTVVVGNPPYITVKDKALNERYRSMYSTCSGKYALTVPFAQRFFELAKRGDNHGDGAGYVGQITSNSFMKREFGKNLINDLFAGKVDLTEVIDGSGAFIPGHGTPTVILVGRNRLASRRYSGRIRTVLGVRGEPSQPADPAKGLVWTAIERQIDNPGSESEWISVVELHREQLSKHPWSLTGGGAGNLQNAVDQAGHQKLADLATSIGITCFTLEDDLYVQPAATFSRSRVPKEFIRPMALGDGLRDWNLATPDHAVFPYDENFTPIDVELQNCVLRFMWRARTSVANSRMFGQQTKVDSGLRWSEYGRLTPGKLRTPLSISFAFVATHNQFVLDRGGKVFNRSAPVIKLPEGLGEDAHLELLGVLNSSTACFWLKQVCHDKGSQSGTGGFMHDEWERFYEFTGTKLLEFPLPVAYPLTLSRKLDGLAQRLMAASPAAIAAAGAPTRQRLDVARTDWSSLRAQMIALQEELDWQVYNLYGVIDEDLSMIDAPPLALGERAFEIVLARKVAAKQAETVWFARHASTPITELPAHWSPEYRALVERRIAVIESDRNIGLIERPECKRRWATRGWDAMQTDALRDWLLDRLEASDLWSGAPKPQSVAQLADRLRHDDDFRSVLDLWVGSDAHDLVKTIGKLVADEHVPFLPIDRYKPAGRRKRIQWERTWALQRREDAGETIKDIPVPPKYATADFLKFSYWANRGKLDVPKERFISYPRTALSGDVGELLGWAGWDHLQQAQALAALYLDRKTQASWSEDRLLPILAGIAELEPWLHQWYTEPRPGYPGTPAEFFSGLIDTELNALGADRAALTKLRGLEELS